MDPVGLLLGLVILKLSSPSMIIGISTYLSNGLCNVLMEAAAGVEISMQCLGIQSGVLLFLFRLPIRED